MELFHIEQDFRKDKTVLVLEKKKREGKKKKALFPAPFAVE